MNLIVALLLTLQPQMETDHAVRKGVAFLKSKTEELGETRDVVLWTLASAQVRESDPLLQSLLKGLLSRPLEVTRSVALQAMILQELEPSKYRVRIAQCAQFLVDNQGADGHWDAGRAVPMPELTYPEPKFPPRSPSRRSRRSRRHREARPQLVARRDQGRPAGPAGRRKLGLDRRHLRRDPLHLLQAPAL
jgi:hypothetical protein